MKFTSLTALRPFQAFKHMTIEMYKYHLPHNNSSIDISQNNVMI